MLGAGILFCKGKVKLERRGEGQIIVGATVKSPRSDRQHCLTMGNLSGDLTVAPHFRVRLKEKGFSHFRWGR